MRSAARQAFLRQATVDGEYAGSTVLFHVLSNFQDDEPLCIDPSFDGSANK